MAKKTDEFRRDAVRMALTSGLTRPQLASDLGVSLTWDMTLSQLSIYFEGRLDEVLDI